MAGVCFNILLLIGLACTEEAITKMPLNLEKKKQEVVDYSFCFQVN